MSCITSPTSSEVIMELHFQGKGLSRLNPVLCHHMTFNFDSEYFLSIFKNIFFYEKMCLFLHKQ